jgi:FkbM family methyltransferase
MLIDNCIYGKFKCFTKDNVICSAIKETGAWEKHLSEEIEKYYKPNTIYVDIGANYGTHSVYIANKIKKEGGTGKVLSFECQPKIIEIFKENVNINELNDYIQLFEYGLGNTEGSLDMIIPKDYNNHNNPGGISLKNNNLTETENKISVPIKKLDDLDLNNISIIKIDVEGFELEAFEGGIETIKRNKPYILIEIWANNKDKYFEWINTNFPFYEIKSVSNDDYLLVPKE